MQQVNTNNRDLLPLKKQSLNNIEFYGTTEVRWSENGRIIVIFETGETEFFKWSRSTYKQLVKNLEASEGKTHSAIIPEKIKSYLIHFNVKCDHLLKSLFPDMVFSFDSDDMKMVKGDKHRLNYYEGMWKDADRINRKVQMISTSVGVKAKPEWLEFDATYRVNRDGSLELVKRLDITNRKSVHDFPAFTVTAVGEKANA